MKKLHVIYVGNPDFAIIPLKSLLKDNRFIVTSVVSGIDKKMGRGKTFGSQAVANFAELNKLIVRKTDDIKKIEHDLQDEKPDFMIIFAFGQILPKSTLNIPKYGCINIHPSILPKYRGATPVQEAILNGDKKTGVTLIRMDEKMDTGDILKFETIALNETINSEALREMLSVKAASFLGDTLFLYAQAKLKTQKQNDKMASYCQKIKKEDGWIDFKNETAVKIDRKIRAFTPWPSAYFFLHGKRIKILSATAHVEQKISAGEIKKEDNEKLLIGTQKGTIELLEIQPEGKNKMSVKEFLKGYRGDLLIS